ncbi:lyase family protein [Microbacterium sp.]|uniref:lyase family protein n=1 Tax=Microbacterium sp. TaxID=51671 RepID=UPI003A914A98
MTQIDQGLLQPVTVGHDDAVSDAMVLDALVTAEAALARAWNTVGVAPDAAAAAVSQALGWRRAGARARDHGIDVAALAEASTAGGNPVIPLVAQLRERVPADARVWVHRGATSQDIVDTALMFVARGALTRIALSLEEVACALGELARERRDEVAAARTLTQQAVPTTVGLRAATWLRGVRRAMARLQDAELPAQLGGAAGTLASFVAIGGEDAAAALPAAFARELRLAVPAAPWHTTRWPVTELGDALVQAIDAVGVIATDVATLSRTEIGELAEGEGGGSSAMPQKHNPVRSVLIRSAALRAPQLGATLHLASALAVDERPDGAWHAEWPTLRELLRLALGASAHAEQLVRGLRVDSDAVARNAQGVGMLAERLSIVLGAAIGRDRVAALVAGAGDRAALAEALRALPEAADLDIDALLDPAGYTGLAHRLVADAAPTGEADEAAATPAPKGDA